MKRREMWAGGGVLLILLLGAGVYWKRRSNGVVSTPVTPQPKVRLDIPHPLATWPWPEAAKDTPHRGVTHWLARSSDGTTLDLFDFDFGANPNLRLEFYDQDEDDKKPFDNIVDYQTRGLGQVTRHLNTKLKLTGRGQIVAAWNGLFFGYNRKVEPATAFHVAPMIIRGRVLYGVPNHRWSFGVKYEEGSPVFKTLHLPNQQRLAREFDFGSGGAQCLIKDGRPLKLQPFPKPDEPFMNQPVPSSPQEAGHIPRFDHMKTSRVSLAWSRDHRHLFLLFVKEPDTEANSGYVLRWRRPDPGGWMVSDVQRFWQSMMKQNKIWNAINSDAGGVAQLAYLRPDGKYILVPPGAGSSRVVFGPDFKNAPPGGPGGAIMYFYVRDGGREAMKG